MLILQRSVIKTRSTNEHKTLDFGAVTYLTINTDGARKATLYYPLFSSQPWDFCSRNSRTLSPHITRISLGFFWALSQLLYSDYRILSRNRENIKKKSVVIRAITLAIMWSFRSFQFAIVLEFLLTYINDTHIGMSLM